MNFPRKRSYAFPGAAPMMLLHSRYRLSLLVLFLGTSFAAPSDLMARDTPEGDVDVVIGDRSGVLSQSGDYPVRFVALRCIIVP